MGRDVVGTPENIRRGRREGGGRELAQAAGTASHSPWSQILFPVWLQPLAGPEVELPSESRRQDDRV